jgi:hypothetical protein
MASRDHSASIASDGFVWALETVAEDPELVGELYWALEWMRRAARREDWGDATPVPISVFDLE